MNHLHARNHRDTGGPDLPPDKSQNIGFLSNTGQDPLKIIKIPIRYSMFGHHRHADDDPIIHVVVFNSSLINKKKKKMKNIVSVGAPLARLFGSAHDL